MKKKYHQSNRNRLIEAFHFSRQGYAAAWREEAAFRQVLLLTLFLAVLAFSLPLSGQEKIILIIPLGISVIVELLNSAIENIVDLASPEFHLLAKKAKDMGSAAQFTALVLLTLVWGTILWGRFCN